MAKLTIGTEEKRYSVLSARCSEEHIAKFELIHEAFGGSKRQTMENMVDVMEAVIGEVQAGGRVVLQHTNGTETELHFKL